MTQHPSGEIQLVGYFPGVIGKITELHSTYYFENWGFDVTFETQVGSELSHFMREFDAARDGFWAALLKGSFAGAIAIDGHKSATEGARLRWFIVEPALQGMGIGKALMEKAMEFCVQAGHQKVYLWTFQGLDCARKLYELHGFRLTEEHRVNQWGRVLMEQRFDLKVGSSP